MILLQKVESSHARGRYHAARKTRKPTKFNSDYSEADIELIRLVNVIYYSFNGNNVTDRLDISNSFLFGFGLTFICTWIELYTLYR